MARKKSFKGGVHPLRHMHHGKILSENSAISPCSVPDEIIMPLSQHIGAPAVPIVSVGDKVDMGQKIAEAGGFVSVPIFSSVSGTVKALEACSTLSGRPCDSIIIENDHEDRLSKDIVKPAHFSELEPKQIVDIIKEAGIVGLGGAAFPTHVKLSPPPEKKIDTLLINGAECEPYLTADHRIMLERPKQIVLGIKAMSRALGVKKAIVGIEVNKLDAIDAIEKYTQNENIEVIPLKVKYPQGAEKQLIDAALGRKVPSGKLPMDVGCVVVNAGTAYQVSLAIEKGLPLFERVVTVTGSVNQPSNLMIRLGTPLAHVISHVGGFSGDVAKVISGGPMMGLSQQNLDAPIEKGSSGVLVLSHKIAKATQESDCIRCCKCIQVCPMGLQPYLIDAHSNRNDFAAAEKENAFDCMECGACSYVCPANRYLVQSIRLAKAQLTAQRKKEKQ
jgi:electron transport complex protein RnfC